MRSYPDIWYGGGACTMPMSGIDVPIDACSWGPYEADGRGGVLVWLLVARRRITEDLSAAQAQPLVEDIPALMPVRGVAIPSGEPVSMAELEPSAPLATLAASWLLMAQPLLTDRSYRPADAAGRRKAASAGLPDPAVTIIELRRRYRPHEAGEDGVDLAGRRYRHRWVVSGHWRDQPYGPAKSLRRKQWIPAYLKGPDGAPLLATERVNVWRR